MKEQIHTVPVKEAFDSGDECHFCWLARQAEGAGRSSVRPSLQGQVRAVSSFNNC